MHDTPILTLDVRPLIQAGTAPLPTIIEAKSRLMPGQALRLIAPFDPKPLYALFEVAGFTVQATKLDTNDWEIFFAPPHPDSGALREIDLRKVATDEAIRQMLEAIAPLGREQRLQLLTSERPEALLAKLNADTTDYDCEPSASKSHWVTTIWRR